MLVRAVRVVVCLEEVVDLLFVDVWVWFGVVVGIGVWIVVEVIGLVFGDFDAVFVGDYYLKNVVVYVLVGEFWVIDECMFELLVLWVGYWVVVLCLLGLEGFGVLKFGLC